MKSTFFALAAMGAAGSASAAVSAYGQCGGQGFSGETTCVSGYTCQKQNDWYSQCVPGAGSSSPATSKAVVTSAKATTTSAAPSKAPVSTSQAVVTSAASSGKVKVRIFLYIDNKVIQN